MKEVLTRSISLESSSLKKVISDPSQNHPVKYLNETLKSFKRLCRDYAICCTPLDLAKIIACFNHEEEGCKNEIDQGSKVTLIVKSYSQKKSQSSSVLTHNLKPSFYVDHSKR